MIYDFPGTFAGVRSDRKCIENEQVHRQGSLKSLIINWQQNWCAPCGTFRMLNNQLKTAYRQLLRNRSYTVINIVGLAAGIAVVLLIFVFIRFETSYDDFHSKK